MGRKFPTCLKWRATETNGSARKSSAREDHGTTGKHEFKSFVEIQRFLPRAQTNSLLDIARNNSRLPRHQFISNQRWSNSMSAKPFLRSCEERNTANRRAA